MNQTQLPPEKKSTRRSATLQSYFFAGLILWLPVIATILVIRFLIEMLDSVLTFLPERYQPDLLLGFHIPGLGLCFSVLVLVLTGIVVTNFLGKWLVSCWESLLSHIPFVNTIYNSIKQVLETVFSAGSDSFRRVFLVEYPRKGMWAIAFQTSHSCLPKTQNGELTEMYTIFIPTTPNPTSGFLMMIDKSDVVELDLSVDEALKLIISLGVVQPDKLPAKVAK